jgi:hypothetical protein
MPGDVGDVDFDCFFLDFDFFFFAINAFLCERTHCRFLAGGEKEAGRSNGAVADKKKERGGLF